MSDIEHILVVDDEEDIRETIEDYFSAHGFLVHAAADGAAMREVVQAQPIAVVLLDLRMPGEDGFTLCRYLRESFDLGVIMLTGSTDTVDKVVGLEMGADDYVAKPFDLRELLARVKSVLRRVRSDKPSMRAAAQGSAEGAAAPAGRSSGRSAAAEIIIGDCRLNVHSRTLRNATGELLPLTSMEFDLLKAFADNPDRVLTRDQLLEKAHNRDWEPFDRSIDVRITRLRRKIERDPSRPRIIRTIRGVGYMLSTDAD